MYTQKVTTQDQAICHLFFHCCLKDGRFSETEIDTVSEQLVKAGLHGKLNFKEEVVKYNSYKDSITDDIEYVQFLMQLIKPANELALYSYCVELCLGDAELSLAEENLLNDIAGELSIGGIEQEAVRKVLAQRKVVEMEKIV